MISLSRRQKIVYFSLAFSALMLFRHLLGPQLGLDDIVLLVSSYIFGISVATAYLYVTLKRNRVDADHASTGKSIQ